MEPYVGQIIPVGFNFAPVGWLLCNGQVVSIAEYETLFALIGTIYGGDGQQTFGIPDLRGRVPLHAGQGNGLSAYQLGQLTGTESVTLLSTQLGSHTHPLLSSSKAATSITPDTNSALGVASAGEEIFVYGDAAPDTSLVPGAITNVGGNQPHENRQPFLAVNYIIAFSGIFPARN